MKPLPYGMGSFSVSAFLAIVCILSAVDCASAAEEATFPVSTYSKAELAALRAWEKKWVGQKIDKTNVDAVAEYLPKAYVGVYKNPQKWGVPEDKKLHFTIVPYKTVMPTSGRISATKKYAPTVTVGEDGFIENYADIAGVPFPDPETGLEVAWNFDFNTHGDTSCYIKHAPNVNPKSRSERPSEQKQWEYFFMHRTEIDPRPAVPDNPKGIHRGIFMHMYEPAEFLNTRYYSLRFADPKKEDVMYMWYAQFRRIRRLSTAQRCDSIDGTDIIYDDEFFWDGHITRNHYTFKGKKELLCCRHQDISRINRPGGQVPPSNISLERCNTLVVDVVSKNPNYLYSKRVWYVDPESYLILWTDIYDQNGRFWKGYMQITSVVDTAVKEKKHFIVGTTYIDFQRIHGGTQTSDIQGVSIDLDPDMFSISYLQKTY